MTALCIIASQSSFAFITSATCFPEGNMVSCQIWNQTKAPAFCTLNGQGETDKGRMITGNGQGEIMADSMSSIMIYLYNVPYDERIVSFEAEAFCN